jgi:hypothetical protein
MSVSSRSLYLGDAIVLAAITVLGFATHGEASPDFLPRMLTTFLPLTAAWLLLAPWFELFDRAVASDLRQLWRPACAMLFAAPLAALLRGLLLGGPILPIFVVVLGATGALGLTVWRWIFALAARSKS